MNRVSNAAGNARAALAALTKHAAREALFMRVSCGLGGMVKKDRFCGGRAFTHMANLAGRSAEVKKGSKNDRKVVEQSQASAGLRSVRLGIAKGRRDGEGLRPEEEEREGGNKGFRTKRDAAAHVPTVCVAFHGRGVGANLQIDHHYRHHYYHRRHIVEGPAKTWVG
ncbi:LANO_0G06304g1_1 [Lachancea nothofagi CBS 11611]|uniref:LANO_0G06304g1_1 n=1 Tax=Lachancea nothofagi CBS 11611 TaxID=1266666 RepID=A0A1G4KGZ3_9SACH|nr:LANO_0G06304g1_1 [Lachancea nothofagi CBS 11611]